MYVCGCRVSRWLANSGQAFGQKFGKDATLVKGFTNLYAMEIDPSSSMQEMIEQGK